MNLYSDINVAFVREYNVAVISWSSRYLKQCYSLDTKIYVWYNQKWIPVRLTWIYKTIVYKMVRYQIGSFLCICIKVHTYCINHTRNVSFCWQLTASTHDELITVRAFTFLKTFDTFNIYIINNLPNFNTKIKNDLNTSWKVRIVIVIQLRFHWLSYSNVRCVIGHYSNHKVITISTVTSNKYASPRSFV